MVEKLAVFVVGVIFVLYCIVMLLEWLATSWFADFLALSLVGFFIYRYREAILTRYYTLTPHPARRVVNDAIQSGAPIDGALYAEVTEPVFGGRIESQVRTQQALVLTSRLRAHDALLRAAEAREMERLQRKIDQEVASRKAHLDLLGAGIDHEISAARLDELRREAGW
jgi:hypothetical protein